MLVLEPKVFGDARGFFLESYNEKTMAEGGIRDRFVQDNHSFSARNVLRGLHYQIQCPQGKLVRVVAGEIFDVAVDLRRSSPAFGKWHGVTLSGENKRMLWVPRGLAHGFLVRSETAHVLYKATDYYAPQHERLLPGMIQCLPLVGRSKEILWFRPKTRKASNYKTQKHSSSFPASCSYPTVPASPGASLRTRYDSRCLVRVVALHRVRSHRCDHVVIRLSRLHGAVRV